MSYVHSKRIFKYKLNIATVVTKLELPKDSKPIKVDVDPMGDICLWAIVPVNQSEKAEFTINLVGTGGFVHEGIDGEYIGTFFAREFVFHAFYLAKEIADGN